MDIDAFSALRQQRWNRLQDLARSRRRSGADADELTRLYRSTASDLSAVRSAAPEPALITRLSMLLAQSRIWLTGSHQVSTGDFVKALAVSMPAAAYRVRWWGVITAAAVVGLATVAGIYTYHSPEALDLVGTPEARQVIAEQEFASYYTEYDNTSFAARVWTNNGWLAAQCIILGFTGFFPLLLMYNTVIQLGVAGAIMAEFGMLDIFFQLIAPHGLLELSAVFVAAASGFRVFWAMLVPGKRPRSVALAEAFRTLLLVALVLVITLFVSGLLEGYLTPSNLPWPVKVTIGSIACLAFWIYIFGVGRWAAAKSTGDVDAQFRAEVAPVAA